VFASGIRDVDVRAVRCYDDALRIRKRSMNARGHRERYFSVGSIAKLNDGEEVRPPPRIAAN
jgi:hypothetical protein